MSKVDISPLFTPFRLGHVTLRNRFVMPAMQRGQARDCVPSEAMVAYYRDRAAGGVALVISEGCGLDHPSSYWQPIFSKIAAESMGVWGRTIEAVKREGAHFLLQLWHPGAMRRLDAGAAGSASPSLSPSGLIRAGAPNGKAMDRTELEDIKGAFVKGAERIQSLGGDGVELHAAHGYLLDEFLWAETNLRDDRYGGATLAERARYPAEVVAAIRQACGPDFIISFRFSQFKEIDYKATLTKDPAELRSFLHVIRDAGADALHVSTRRFGQVEFPDSAGGARSLAAWVRESTGAPTIAIGSVGLNTDVFSDLHEGQNPVFAIEEDLHRLAQGVRKGQFDLVGVGRSQIANSDFVRKVEEGRLDELVCFNKSIHLNDFLDGIDLDQTIRGDLQEVD